MFKQAGQTLFLSITIHVHSKIHITCDFVRNKLIAMFWCCPYFISSFRRVRIPSKLRDPNGSSHFHGYLVETETSLPF